MLQSTRSLTINVVLSPESLPVLATQQSGPHDIYWSIGDSGPQTDPKQHGQNIDDLHGTIVRITVPTSGTSYTIPAGNVAGGTSSRMRQTLTNDESGGALFIKCNDARRRFFGTRLYLVAVHKIISFLGFLNL